MNVLGRVYIILHLLGLLGHEEDSNTDLQNFYNDLAIDIS